MLKLYYCRINILISFKDKSKKTGGWASSGTGAREVVEYPSLEMLSIWLDTVLSTLL